MRQQAATPDRQMRTDKKLKAKGEAATVLLKELYPESQCALEHGGDAWRLLVMARLSAQCTDARVNIVCRDLFKRFPDCFSMADGDLCEIENLVKPCGLYRMKAASIKETSKILAEKYGGRVPDTMEELLELPGVGRKIANLIMGDVWGKGGIVADTHCMRICSRLGFFEEGKKDPLFTEKVMDLYIEKDEQTDFCHRIVSFGRDVCSARSPKCSECTLSGICRKYSADTNKTRPKEEKK